MSPLYDPKERVMRFEQVKDVLHHVIDFHAALAADYRMLAKQVGDERARLLLLYLAEHESRMSRGLVRYTEGNAHNVLDTWLQNAPDLKEPHLLKDLRSGLCCTTIEEVSAAAEKIHETLGQMYRQLADASTIADERELFEALAKFQNAETRRLVRNTSRMDM